MGHSAFLKTSNSAKKIETNKGVPFYVLRPSLADLMMKVKRRTTIIYPKEAGIILLELGIESGSRVIEIGSGSGSLTVLLSRIVGKEGRVYSFERRAEHQEIAIANVKKFGKIEHVEFLLKDPVAENGFGVGEVDAIFVDIPTPWVLVPHVWKALRPGGHVGFLSPNIEQVQTTIKRLEENGFVRIRTIEVWTRGIRVKEFLTRPFDRMVGHTGYLFFAQKVDMPATEYQPEYFI
jgi:tRNA (adenine57-N1/adenine58-N1)-methyltransferase